jgi:hypothetical protein
MIFLCVLPLRHIFVFLLSVSEPASEFWICFFASCFAFAVVDPLEMKRQAANLAYAFVGLGVGMLIVVTAQKHSFNVIGERLTMQVQTMNSVDHSDMHVEHRVLYLFCYEGHRVFRHVCGTKASKQIIASLMSRVFDTRISDIHIMNLNPICLCHPPDL